MTRWLKISLIVLPWALLGLVVWDQLRRIDFFAIDAGTQSHILGRESFLADLAYEGCVTRGSVIATAEARDWLWQDGEPGQCLKPDDLTDWLEIKVQPALPFSTDMENNLFLGFDGNGCMRDWQNATGPGTTCPDR